MARAWVAKVAKVVWVWAEPWEERVVEDLLLTSSELVREGEEGSPGVKKKTFRGFV